MGIKEIERERERERERAVDVQMQRCVYTKMKINSTILFIIGFGVKR
jgi:hypothetical protein